MDNINPFILYIMRFRRIIIVRFKKKIIMPTVEIVSVKNDKLHSFDSSKYFGVCFENNIESHHCLFDDFLKDKDGSIAHIGNKEFEENNFELCWASDIVDWDDNEIIIPMIDPNSNEHEQNWGQNQEFHYTLKEECLDDLIKLFKFMLSESPLNEIYFFTRYQFGPEKGEVIPIMDFDYFRDRHLKRYLRWNTLYVIKG